MKRISVLILSFLLIATIGFTQNIKLIYNGTTLNNNASIDTFGSNTLLFAIPLVIKNNTSSTAQIKVKKTVHFSVPGSDVSFCFAGNCFDPSVIISPTTAVINPNATDSSYTSDYSANGHNGGTSVTYAFYNINGTGDTAKVTFNFNTSISVNDISKSDIYFSDAFPNPASSITTIAYNLPKLTKTASIRISNIIGSKVTEIALQDLNGKKSIDLNDFTKGIYFYSLLVNDKIYYTKKLVVK
jgi:hypothetical protein